MKLMAKTTSADRDTCPRCKEQGMVSRIEMYDRWADEPVRHAGCAACGADLDYDTLADLGTTDGD